MKSSTFSSIEKAPIPKIAVIPLSQHTGIPAKPIVEPNTYVKVGTKIGEPSCQVGIGIYPRRMSGASFQQGNISAPPSRDLRFVSTNIHSSISGVVKSIEPRVHPMGGNCLSVVIESDGKDESELFTPITVNPPPKSSNINLLTLTEIIEKVKEAGIVDADALPTYLNFSKSIDTIILNGIDNIEYMVMTEYTKKALLSGMLLLKAMEAKNGYIAIEDDKSKVIKKIQPIAKEFGFELRVVQTKYPNLVSQIVYMITKRKVPYGGTPTDVGVYVQDVSTAIDIYEACTNSKPVIERVVTVKGDVKEPKTLLVRIGTPFKGLIELCGGYISEPEKIIMGSLMTGVAQFTDTVPVIKTTKEIWIQTTADLPLDNHCIRCGYCVEACSMGLLPGIMVDYMIGGKFEKAKKLGVMHCIECANCAYVCPAKRNLVHWIMYGKAKLAIV